jgi:hypothetical protein
MSAPLKVWVCRKCRFAIRVEPPMWPATCTCEVPQIGPPTLVWGWEDAQ